MVSTSAAGLAVLACEPFHGGLVDLPDPAEALRGQAQIVCASGAPITLVPLDVTTQVRIRREDLSGLRRGDGLAALIADQLERYMGHMKRDWTYAHDPLAVAALARPDLLRTYPMRVNVETRGEYTRAQTVAERVDGEAGGPAVDVALEVQAGAFERWLLDTLAGSGAAPVVDGGT